MSHSSYVVEKAWILGVPLGSYWMMVIPYKVAMMGISRERRNMILYRMYSGVPLQQIFIKCLDFIETQTIL